MRWAGSKRQSLPALAAFWSDRYARYVEPFAGSCSLFFHLAPRSALLGDLNDELIITYRSISHRPRKIHELAAALPVNKTTFNRVRALDPVRLGLDERAARFVYLNRNCFNGLYRTNRQGQFNVPFAGRKQGALPSEEEFVQAAQLLRRASLVAGSFETTLALCRRGDFVYLDPPYVVEEQRTFLDYGPRIFTSRDIDALGAQLERLDQTGVAFVMSYAKCRAIEAIAAKWTQTSLTVRRNIAGFSGARRRATEIVLTNID
jgi:DNA adenine methylase